MGDIVLRAKVEELIAAIKAEIGSSPKDQTDLPCHRGLVTAKACARCSRERRIYAAIAVLEQPTNAPTFHWEPAPYQRAIAAQTCDVQDSRGNLHRLCARRAAPGARLFKGSIDGDGWHSASHRTMAGCKELLEEIFKQYYVTRPLYTA